MKTKEKMGLPKWFEGKVYASGDTVKNPFTGAETELNNNELSMYDFIMGAQWLMERGQSNRTIDSEFRKGLDWFRHSNAEAYMVLLD
jgi:hypothetical protein